MNITQFAVYISGTPVTLKYGIDHKAWYEWVDQKQGYNHATFETHRFNNDREKRHR